MKRATAILALCVGTAWSSTALALSVTRSSSFAYDAASGLITQEVVEPGTPALRLETDTTYDAFGNKTSVVTSGIDIATRGNSSTYDARGQFVTTNTNALAQSETLVFDPKFGKPISQTGPNGLTTTWSYDTFGRKILEVRADGTRTAYSYVLCPSPCTAGASYYVTATPLASDGVTQNGPISTVYFDSLDRELGRDTQGFDGSTVRARRAYDTFGRLMQTTRPFFTAGGVRQWTFYTYDALGRVLTTTLPDGSVSQMAYHGLTTTETNANNQTRTVTKNARGDVVSVTDAKGQVMTYRYDPLGKLLTTTDALGNAVSATYDTRGRKISSSDPDMGTWSYSYDTLDELVSQTDAKSQTTTFVYDKLGRQVQRTEPDMTSLWTYDSAPMGKGQLASTSITAGPGAGYQRTFAYDSLGRPYQTATTVDGNVYTFSATRDSNGRLSTVTYPSGFVAQYSYNSLGYSNQLADGTSHQVHWTLNALDSEQHITQQTSGNGIVTTRSFSATTGRLLAIDAGNGNLVQNLSYTYDSIGNLLTRVDSNTNLSESAVYDNLNRLISATIASNVAPVKNFNYDAIGNLITKSDVGSYTYPASGAGSSLPHAVTGVNGLTISTTFTYDPNGNQISGLGRTTVWTSYNKPASITQGSSTISFLDGPDHQRFKQVTAQGKTLYFDSFGVHAELVVATGPGKWNEYLTVGNVMVGVRFLDLSTETVATRYFHADNLGSISVITDETGNVLERLSYDAWGKRRYPNGADDPAGAITSQTTRGFTEQEELSVGGLVHLNGRIYDPLMGRMMSADPTIPDSLNPQSWNRYSYVGNDPLTFTDPNGFSWLTNIFHDIAHFFRSIFANPLVRAIVQIAIAAILSSLGQGPIVVALAAAASAAIVTGLSGGKLADILKAAVIAGATALAFYEVGELTPQPKVGPLNIAHLIENIAGHAGVGCLSAVASGGRCGPGAISAAAGAAATPLVNDVFPHPDTNLRDTLGGSAISGVVGGLASLAGGGKFEDGAVTAAFGYLFNATKHLGLSFSIPGFVADAITEVRQWLTGDTHLMMGNTGYFGIVWQYPSYLDQLEGKPVPYDFGVYGGGGVPAGELPSLQLSGALEFGGGTGMIHGTFDGRSLTYQGMFDGIGASATFSGNPSYPTGFAFMAGAGYGISGNATITSAYTIRDYFSSR